MQPVDPIVATMDVQTVTVGRTAWEDSATWYETWEAEGFRVIEGHAKGNSMLSLTAPLAVLEDLLDHFAFGGWAKVEGIEPNARRAYRRGWESLRWQLRDITGKPYPNRFRV